jgi:hypothetical protein
VTAYLLPCEASYYAALLREVQQLTTCRGRAVSAWSERRMGDEMRLRVECASHISGSSRHPVMSYEQPVTFATDAQALLQLEEEPSWRR